MEPIKGKKIPASLAIIAVYAMANAAAQAHEVQKINANKNNDASDVKVDLTKQAPSIIDINSLALDLNQSATEQTQNKIDHAQVQAFSKDVMNKKATREALQDVYGYLIQRYGQDNKSILDTYLADFYSSQVSLAADYYTGNNDSTTNGIGIAPPGALQTQTNGSMTVCHNACHCHCHGSRGWR